MNSIIILFLWMPLVAFGSQNSSESFYFILSQFFNFSLFVMIILYIIYKTAPEILKKQKQQFLSNRHKHILTLEKNKKLCQELIEEIKQLDKKIKQIDKQVTEAIKNQKDNWKNQMIERQALLEKSLEKSLEKDKFKAIKELKNKTIKTVLESAKAHIMQKNLRVGLEQHMIKQLEKI